MAAALTPYGTWLLIGYMALSWIYSVDCVFFNNVGKMTPMNPTLEVGQTLILNCTLTTYKGPYNASSITFRWNGTTFPPEYVTVLSDKIAQFVYPNITIDMDKLYNCYINNTKLIHGQHVRLGYKPVKPVVDRCTVFNWEKMECYWLPASQSLSTNRPTKVSLSWSLLVNQSDSWYSCPQPYNNTCTWKPGDGTDSFRPDMWYHLMVKASNDLGSKQSEVHTQNTKIIVKPDAVSNLRVDRTTSTSLKIVWNSPKPGRELIYRITYTSQWKPTEHKVVNVTNVSNVLLEELTPDTQYTIQVEAKPIRAGFWSEKAHIKPKTLMDVPGSVPGVTRGGFQVIDCGDDCQEIVLYWQGIPPMDYNAPVLNYIVSIHHISECQSRSEIRVNSNQHSINMTSPRDCPLILTVQATNTEGTAKNQQAVYIAESSKLPPHPTNLLVEAQDKETVHVEWTSEDPATSSHTVFWCRGSLVDKLCQGPVHWQSVPVENGTFYTVHLKPGEEYINVLFGLSKETDDEHSSGIIWSDCSYNQKEVSLPPKANLTTPYEHKSLMLSWISPGCSEQRGYIISYTIFYCPVDEHKKCTDPVKNVSCPGNMYYYTIRDLEPFQTYRLQLDSVTKAGHSHSKSSPLYGTPTDTWFRGSALVGVAVGIVLADLLVIAGVVFLCLRCKKCHRWWTKGLDIKMPEKRQRMAMSTSSDLALMRVGYCEDPSQTWYKTQDSTESTADSGHGSMSDQHLVPAFRPQVSISEESEPDDVFVIEPAAATTDADGYLRPVSRGNDYLQPLPGVDTDYLKAVPQVANTSHLKPMHQEVSKGVLKPISQKANNNYLIPVFQANGYLKVVPGVDKSHLKPVSNVDPGYVKAGYVDSQFRPQDPGGGGDPVLPQVEEEKEDEQGMKANGPDVSGIGMFASNPNYGMVDVNMGNGFITTNAA